ncbi:hypothetical protein, partial [Caulobacter sp. B11]|uniref:hypothetical protein n=1 Tax=Caulobacter sp. B11 TaxID=2048899 RepID=UPI001F3EE7CB
MISTSRPSRADAMRPIGPRSQFQSKTNRKATMAANSAVAPINDQRARGDRPVHASAARWCAGRRIGGPSTGVSISDDRAATPEAPEHNAPNRALCP